MTTRRRVLAALGTLVLPRGARAQTMGKMFRIGITSHSATSAELAGPQPQRPNVQAFLQALRERGLVYGEHYVTEVRGGEATPERYAALAIELVGLRVDVIVSSGIMLSPLKKATSTIPIVMAAATDPVGEGFVRSLAQPGGNFTGMSHQIAETTGKRLELLKELVPGAASVAIIRGHDAGGVLTGRFAEAAARDRGWKLVSFEVRKTSDLETAFKAAADARAGAVLVAAGGPFFRHVPWIAELAARNRLPAMYPFREYTEAGGLVSYSSDLTAIWRRAAFFVDKIVKGARPADLPVEQPTRFELVINLKTARTLGLTVPPSLLLRADQVIE